MAGSSVLIRITDNGQLKAGDVIAIQTFEHEYGAFDLVNHIRVLCPDIQPSELQYLLQELDADGFYIGRKWRGKLTRVAEVVQVGKTYTYTGSVSNLEKFFFDKVY